MGDVPLEIACIRAACAWFATALPAALGAAVVVTDEWPEPDQKLPERALSIVCAGPRDDTMLGFDISEAVMKDATTGLYTWQIKATQQAVQADLWATSRADRDALMWAFDDVSCAGPRSTLPARTGFNPAAAMPVRDGLALVLGDGFKGFVDATFDSPQRMSGQSLREREYRASSAGVVSAVLEITAESPRMALLNLALELAPQGGDSYVINAATGQITDTD